MNRRVRVARMEDTTTIFHPFSAAFFAPRDIKRGSSTEGWQLTHFNLIHTSLPPTSIFQTSFPHLGIISTVDGSTSHAVLFLARLMRGIAEWREVLSALPPFLVSPSFSVQSMKMNMNAISSIYRAEKHIVYIDGLENFDPLSH